MLYPQPDPDPNPQPQVWAKEEGQRHRFDGLEAELKDAHSEIKTGQQALEAQIQSIADRLDGRRSASPAEPPATTTPQEMATPERPTAAKLHLPAPSPSVPAPPPPLPAAPPLPPAPTELLAASNAEGSSKELWANAKEKLMAKLALTRAEEDAKVKRARQLEAAEVRRAAARRQPPPPGASAQTPLAERLKYRPSSMSHRLPTTPESAARGASGGMRQPVFSASDGSSPSEQWRARALGPIVREVADEPSAATGATHAGERKPEDGWDA